MAWRGSSFGRGIKAVAAAVEPDRPALIHGDRVVSWSEFDRLTDNIAANLLARGLRKGDVAGQHLRNCPEYMLAWFGCAKAGIIPVNVNYQYKAGELRDILNRFGVKALFTSTEFGGLIEEVRGDIPGLGEPIEVDGDRGDWQGLSETAVPGDFEVEDDPGCLFYLATGGTTGMPKAVMWPHLDAWEVLQVSAWPRGGIAAPPWIAPSLEDHAAEAARHPPPSEVTRSPSLILCPMMHGTGMFAATNQLLHGSTLATLPDRHFDADRTIDAIRDLGVRAVVIVGDAFARPLIDRLEARDDGAEAIATMSYLFSSGAIFSMDVKQRFTALNPNLVIADALGSSEAGGTAVNLTTAAGSTAGGDFTAVPDRGLKIVDENLNAIPPGSEEFGMIARAGPLPLGYLGEDEKNAKTFPMIDGVRYLMTGDQARMREDGSLEFKGRDNMCINSGGEKIFPEEVERALMAHPEVADVRVVGVPDERFGNKVTAVVQSRGDTEGLDARLDAYVRQQIAGYKIPRLYKFTDASLRLNNGKPDYRTAQRIAEG